MKLAEYTFDALSVQVYDRNATMGRAAAEAAATAIRQAVEDRGRANVVFATGNSQLSSLAALRDLPDIPWAAVNVFHMDEYIALPAGHPASFSAFLREHLLQHIPYGAFFPVPGHPDDSDAACRAYELLLRAHPVDVCCLGIGENGHIAFNEPPVADFDDPVWVKTVELDMQSRQQQVGEGHFPALEAVPTHAITLTIPALCAAKTMICIVPEQRKAEAVKATLHGPVDTACPASILRRMSHATLYLDQDSAQYL